MPLSCKSILAVGAVVDIALNSSEGPVSALDLADRLQLPRRHLEPALQALVREGILVGLRGPRGGYRLAKARQAISAFDICEAVKTLETEKLNKELPLLLGTVVLPTLAQALKRISVEDLVQAASLQMLASYKPDAMVG